MMIVGLHPLAVAVTFLSSIKQERTPHLRWRRSEFAIVRVLAFYANDLLFACYAINSGSSTAGTGWVLLSGSESHFDNCDCQIVTSTQSAIAAMAKRATTIKNGIDDALV